MISRLCEYKALVNAYKYEIIEKLYFLFVNAYDNRKGLQKFISI